MSRINVGNKMNSYLNGEWAGHVRKRHGTKRLTSKRRRAQGKREICLILEGKSPDGRRRF